MHFGENQLSRSLIGLSPLHTGHPPGFQPWWVRASTRSYPRFTLPMRRSPRFGSTARDSIALFRLAFATATRHRLTSPRTVTRRLILQKARGHPERLPRLVGTRFQALFHDPSPGCFSSFPHGTSSLSVTREYLGLASGLARFTRNSTGSVLLGNTPRRQRSFAYGAVTRYGAAFQLLPLPRCFVTSRHPGRDDKAVPQPPVRNARRLSHVPGLASSAFAHHYSRHRFCFLFLRVLRCFTSPRYHQPPYAFRRRRHPMTGAGFPHSEILESQPGCRLLEAYRRLQRPSSAPGTKTSTVCPYKLDTRHYMQFLQKTEDARVHYAVLKIRTEPCLRAPHPGGPSAGRSSQRPSKAAASSGPNSVLGAQVFTGPRSADPEGRAY